MIDPVWIYNMWLKSWVEMLWWQPMAWFEED
jgi:hypothetical protein